jgi:hypothetical protein
MNRAYFVHFGRYRPLRGRRLNISQTTRESLKALISDRFRSKRNQPIWHADYDSGDPVVESLKQSKTSNAYTGSFYRLLSQLQKYLEMKKNGKIDKNALPETT